MAKIATKGSTSGTKPFWIGLKGERRQLALHPAECGTGYVAAMWLEVCSEELHALIHRADAHLALVERQSKLLFEEPPHLGDEAAKPFTAGAYDIEVIHITPIVAALECALHVVVKPAEIDVAEELAGEVADGQTATFGTEEETFVSRKGLPVGGAALDAAAVRWVEQHNLPRQVAQKRL